MSRVRRQNSSARGLAGQACGRLRRASLREPCPALSAVHRLHFDLRLARGCAARESRRNRRGPVRPFGQGTLTFLMALPGTRRAATGISARVRPASSVDHRGTSAPSVRARAAVTRHADSDGVGVHWPVPAAASPLHGTGPNFCCPRTRVRPTPRVAGARHSATVVACSRRLAGRSVSKQTAFQAEPPGVLDGDGPSANLLPECCPIRSSVCGMGFAIPHAVRDAFEGCLFFSRPPSPCRRPQVLKMHILSCAASQVSESPTRGPCAEYSGGWPPGVRAEKQTKWFLPVAAPRHQAQYSPVAAPGERVEESSPQKCGLQRSLSVAAAGDPNRPAVQTPVDQAEPAALDLARVADAGT